MCVNNSTSFLVPACPPIFLTKPFSSPTILLRKYRKELHCKYQNLNDPILTSAYMIILFNFLLFKVPKNLKRSNRFSVNPM